MEEKMARGGRKQKLRGDGSAGSPVRYDRSPVKKQRGVLRFAVGRYLRALRLHSGLTLEYVSTELKTSHVTVGRLETGEQTIDIEWLEKFAAFYEIQPEDIITGGGSLVSDFRARWLGTLALLGEMATCVTDVDRRKRIEEAIREAEAYGFKVEEKGLRFDLTPVGYDDDDDDL